MQKVLGLPWLSKCGLASDYYLNELRGTLRRNNSLQLAIDMTIVGFLRAASVSLSLIALRLIAAS